MQSDSKLAIHTKTQEILRVANCSNTEPNTRTKEKFATAFLALFHVILRPQLFDFIAEMKLAWEHLENKTWGTCGTHS